MSNSDVDEIGAFVYGFYIQCLLISYVLDVFCYQKNMCNGGLCYIIKFFTL